MSEKSEETHYCSFCNKSQHEVKKLVAGDKVFICDECIDICTNIMKETAQPSPPEVEEKVPPTPRKIHEFLDQYIVGQDDAKISVAVAVYNHFKRIANPVIDGVEIKKSNVLLLGPTGSGKTLIAETVARMLDVPFVIAECTSLTEAGYVGEDVESVLTRLMAAANGDIDKAQRGIIFLDEVDKLKAKPSASGGRDVSGEGVQQALLKMLEGAEMTCTAPGARKNQGETVKIDTTGILFIVSGAFVGLDKIVAEDLNKGSRSMGFSKVTSGNQKAMQLQTGQVTPDHLVKFGLIPEFVGRIPIIAVLKELDEDQLVHVLTDPKNAITKQYGALFGLDGVQLEISDDALRTIAKIAIKRETGARGLRGVLEERLTRVQYDLPEMAADGVTKIVLSPEVFSEGAKPVLVKAVDADA